MHNLVAMTVLYRPNHLLKETSRFVLAHLHVHQYLDPSKAGATYPSFSLGYNVVEQLLSGILHDHDHVCRCCDDFIPIRL